MPAHKFFLETRRNAAQVQISEEGHNEDGNTREEGKAQVNEKHSKAYQYHEGQPEDRRRLPSQELHLDGINLNEVDNLSETKLLVCALGYQQALLKNHS